MLRLRLPIADTLKRTGATEIVGLLASLAPERAKLLALRDMRPQPMRDEKIVASLNGLAIDALRTQASSWASRALLAPAEAAADRLWSEAYDAKTGALKHQLFAGKADGEGYLDDYAMLGDGLLSLAETTHGCTMAEARRKPRRCSRDALLDGRRTPRIRRACLARRAGRRGG